MRYSFACALNRDPHQIPSLNHSLLSGFSPVGAGIAVVPNEKSLKPKSTGVCASADAAAHRTAEITTRAATARRIEAVFMRWSPRHCPRERRLDAQRAPVAAGYGI